VLQQAAHPHRLRDFAEQERLLDRLRVGTAHHPALGCLLPHERAELADGDVPLFTTRPASLDLWSAYGERIANFFEGSGYDRARRRLRQMGEEDFARQLWVVRGALATLPGADAGGPRPIYPAGTLQPAERDELLDAARSVGDRLETLAWRKCKGAEVGWLGLGAPSGGRWRMIALGADLYDGLPGVALFLARLGDLTGEQRYTSLARAALAALREQLRQAESPWRLVGAFDGWGGVIYTLAHLGVLWNETALLAEAEQYVEGLPALIAQDEDLDVVSGSAGCLLGLLALHRSSPSPRTLAAAVLCGERLLARAVPQQEGLGWPTRLPAHAPLTGMAHGAAGIARALLELAAATGEERFRTAALAGLAYERSLFDQGQGNWPDLRRRPGNGAAPAFGVAWCHGAPGIGLARLSTLPILNDTAVRAEIEVALAATRARGFEFNHTLCHGDLGNLELVLEAGRLLGGPPGLGEARRRASGVLESLRTGGPLCATPGGFESPGLMTGLAGTGYALLRLAEPDQVPSVLTLAAPGS
jgi:type 2 lantibiotic biosynthesis protein LanM